MDLKITNKKGEQFTVLYDDADHALLSNYSWYADKAKSTYYVRARVRGKAVRMHRLLLNPADINVLIDHKNLNGLDNRRNNLRVCSFTENNCNKRPKANGSSKYLGVSWSTRDRKWRANINVNGKLRSLGYFSNEIDAAKAYDGAAAINHKEFANLNFSTI